MKGNRYRFMGAGDLCADDTSNQAWRRTLGLFPLAEAMEKHDLCAQALKDFSVALEKGNLAAIQAEFAELDDNQKLGLLTIYIDYNELGYYGIPDLHAPMGRAVQLANKFNHKEIADFFTSELNRLQSSSAPNI